MFLVPALAGLGAPWWAPDARGSITGLSFATGRAHIVRAALEAMAHQAHDLKTAFAADGADWDCLRIDGGMVANDWMAQDMADMLALKPRGLTALEAASAPVVAVTAYQMLFEHANATRGDRVLITGAAGNVGAYAVQMALSAGVVVTAVARAKDEPLLRELGVETVVDSSRPDFERGLPQVDAILDLVGGTTVERCMAALKPGGKLVTVVTASPAPARADVKAEFFYAEVTSARLRVLTEMFERGTITARVGSVVPLAQARRKRLHDQRPGLVPEGRQQQ